MSAASIATRFKSHNTAWKARKAHGRKPKYSCPDQLETACTNYFEWSDAHPLYRYEVMKYRGQGTLIKVPMLRPFSLVALCNHLKIANNTWVNYRRRPDLLRVIEWVEAVIYTQKFEGTAAGIFHVKIVMRDIDVRSQRSNRHV